MQILRLANGSLAVDIAPQIGGGLTRFDWIGGDRTLPVFRPWSPPASDFDRSALPDPNSLACYALLPWSNRIGGSRFEHQGRAVRLPLNRAGERYPIHGDGWLSVWTVEHADRHSATLTLDRSDHAPYTYRARQTYTLRDAVLTIELEIENTGDASLPFGLGVHPFMPREAGTTLTAPANGVWLSGPDDLPSAHAPQPETWNFGRERALPDTLIDNAFTGWSGEACITWSQRGLRVRVGADASFYILYTPPGQDFFCFEPVDHGINAPNLPGGATAHGMTVLAPGERLQRSFRFTVDALGAEPA